MPTRGICMLVSFIMLAFVYCLAMFCVVVNDDLKHLPSLFFLELLTYTHTTDPYLNSSASK